MCLTFILTFVFQLHYAKGLKKHCVKSMKGKFLAKKSSARDLVAITENRVKCKRLKYTTLVDLLERVFVSEESHIS